jgi:hypothetical protein
MFEVTFHDTKQDGECWLYLHFPNHDEDVGCWMLDVGCWMLDVGCWMFEG